MKVGITAFVLLALSFPAFAGMISVNGPIVPCGIGPNSPPCELCHFPVLVKNIIDYMTYYIAFPLAMIMFVVAGYFFLTSGGNPGKVTQARSAFTTTLIGLGIVLLSWLFI